MRIACFLILLLTVMASNGSAQSSATTAMRFMIPDRGCVSVRTSGQATTPVVGYASIQPSADSTTPTGLAILGFRQQGVLISETGVPASPLIRSGRIYAEVVINPSSVAIVNPNDSAATLSFYFSNMSGDTV